MLNFNIKARENERKDGYAIEVRGKVSGNGKEIFHEIYELLMRLDELDGGILLFEALDRYMIEKLKDRCEDCDECEGCEHEDD